MKRRYDEPASYFFFIDHRSQADSKLRNHKHPIVGKNRRKPKSVAIFAVLKPRLV